MPPLCQGKRSWPDFIDLENVRIIEPGPGEYNHPPCLAEAMYGDLDAVLIPMDHYIWLSAMFEHCLDRGVLKRSKPGLKKLSVNMISMLVNMNLIMFMKLGNNLNFLN